MKTSPAITDLEGTLYEQLLCLNLVAQCGTIFGPSMAPNFGGHLGLKGVQYHPHVD